VFALLQGHLTLASRPSLPEEGPIIAKVTLADLEAPEALENQDGDRSKGSLERSDSTQSPPQLHLKNKVQARRGNVRRT
jgi:hypothetical protein